MKRKTSAVACVLALLVWTCGPVRAESRSNMKKNQPWNLRVSATGGNRGVITVSVVYAYSHGGQDTIDSFTVPAPDGNGTVKIDAVYSRIPRGTRHVIVNVRPPSPGGAIVRVTQGNTLVDEPIAEDQEFAWDLVSEP